jgi:type I restriction enzyme M protein
MITGTIKSQVDKVWEAFWTGGVANPITVIEQITYLLFIKRLDDIQLGKEKQASLVGIPITEPIYQKEHITIRWNRFKNESPEVMYSLFTKPEGVFEFMKNVGAIGSVFGAHMKGATFMIPTPKLLDQVVQMIDGIDMVDRDTKGDLYEYLLSKIASAGKNGQFRTPRHIIKLMVEMMEPKADDTVCDPSSGTAGFLVAVGEYFHKKEHEDLFLNKEFREHYNTGMFNGIEFDATMLRIGAMNLQLHGIEQPNLIAKDALGEGNADIKEEYTLVLANPPFKGSLDYDGVDSSLLTMVKTKKTELLFLALMLRIMKKGGRAAVIVPDGVLFGGSNAHKQIRKELIDNQKLDAIISMPSGVFKPYAGVSTAILVFTKTDGGGTDNVWFYDMQADGYSLDDKRNEVKENDIPDILTRWESWDTEAKRKRTDTSFLVPKSEIIENDYDLSINRYKEIVYEEVVYDAPNVILSNIKKLDRERNDALGLLEKLLK